METISKESVELTVEAAQAGWRLDVFLAYHFTDYSRVHLRRVISAGGVSIDGRGGKPAYRLKPGQKVTIILPPIPREAPQPEDIPLDILYEDEHLIVVNKPPGMVVHPARGHWSGTLASALQFHFGNSLSTTGGPSRPGIVHRLDRDTSGVILVARSDIAHAKLAKQFAQRSIEKEYFALVAGCPKRDRDYIDCPIGFHPHQREKMAIRHDEPTSRSAQTFYEVLERFDGFAALKLVPKTGRTHQIRVHLNHIGCPVLCDRQYGGRSKITRGEIRRDATDSLILLDRQALHARRLKFTHPATGESLEIEAPLPTDINAVLEELRKFRTI
ncbi:MAG TPA: RluA family pseudouridine synthase [Thermoguttaceae bacterium]